MWLKAEQLPAALAKQLAAVYFISGDEPLQQGEAADAVRLAAKMQAMKIVNCSAWMLILTGLNFCKRQTRCPFF